MAKIAIKNCHQLILPKGPKSEKYDRLCIKLTTQNSDTCQNKNDENSKIIDIFKCSWNLKYSKFEIIIKLNQYNEHKIDKNKPKPITDRQISVFFILLWLYKS